MADRRSPDRSLFVLIVCSVDKGADDVGIERYAPFAAELVEAACPAP